MVAPIIGAALMKAGGSIAGKSAARSAAGSILSTGGGSNKIGLNIKSLNEVSKKMLGQLKKVTSVLEKSSPMLKQQFTVLRKSFELFLRPIGDIMAKFLRPMAIWFLKLAVLWNKWLGGQGIGGDNEDLGDKLEQLEAEKKQAKEDGDTSKEFILDKQINKIKEKQSGEKGEKGKGLADLFINLIPDSFKDLLAQIKETWQALVGVFTELTPVLGPIFTLIWDVIKFIGGAAILASLEVLRIAFVAIEGVLNVVAWAVKFFWEGLKFLVEMLEVAWEWAKVLGEYLGTTLEKAIAGVSVFFSDLIESIKNIAKKAISWVKSLNPFGKKDREEKAVGGAIDTTGLYKLHAGERVVTAGDNNRSSNSGVSINNSINIQATINSDMDIKQLAERLASYNEVQLRRRVSY